jgi:hypothetical protein
VLDNASTPGTPDWWLLRLGRQLHDDRPRLDTLDAYWRGEHPLPFGNRKMREAYKRFQRMARTNFTLLVAESVVERLRVVGFRAGGDASTLADKQAWDWWQANDMDSASGLVHRAAVVMSRAYVMVSEDPEHPGRVLVTGEDPRQVIHEEDPRNRRRIRAALKVLWDDRDNQHLAVLILPDSIHYYTAKTREKDTTSTLWSVAEWSPSEESVDNPLGEVNVVPFRNRPDLCGNTLGEFEDVLDIQDRINSTVLDRLVIAAMQAYRQRYATGVELTDEQGRPNATFDPGADLLWSVPDDKAKFGDFTAANLDGVLHSVESDLQHLGAITRTPAHYLLGTIVNASGEALAASETGLYAKSCERINEYGASWEKVYQLAGKVIGERVPADAEVIWADPQFRSLNEKAAANVQLVAAGVPWRTRMTMLDFTPQEIERMVVERAQDALLEAALASQFPAAQPGHTPPQPTGGNGSFSMRNGPGSGQGGAATPATVAGQRRGNLA